MYIYIYTHIHTYEYRYGIYIYVRMVLYYMVAPTGSTTFFKNFLGGALVGRTFKELETATANLPQIIL